MPDELMTVEWSEWIPKTGELKVGVAYEDGSGWVRTLPKDPPPLPFPPAFPDNVRLDGIIGVKDAGATA